MKQNTMTDRPETKAVYRAGTVQWNRYLQKTLENGILCI